MHSLSQNKHLIIFLYSNAFLSSFVSPKNLCFGAARLQSINWSNHLPEVEMKDELQEILPKSPVF